MTVASASRHARSSSPSGRFLSTAPRSSAFPSPSSIALNSTAASGTDFSQSKPNGSRPSDLRGELVPRPGPRGREPVMPACLEYRAGMRCGRAPGARGTSGRKPFMPRSMDPLPDRPSRRARRSARTGTRTLLGDRVDEAVPRPEHAVHRAGRRTGFARHSANGQGRRATRLDEALPPRLEVPCASRRRARAGDPCLTSYRHVLRYVT